MWIKLNRKWNLYLNPDTKGIVGNRIKTRFAYLPVKTRDNGWIWRGTYYFQEIEYYMPSELLPKWIKIRPQIIENKKVKTLSPYVVKKENLCSYKISLKG